MASYLTGVVMTKNFNSVLKKHNKDSNSLNDAKGCLHLL